MMLALTATLTAQQPTDINRVSADGTTSLHLAVERNDLAGMERLLRAGAKAQVANRYGVTPLHLAATNGNAAAIARLLDAGADPNTALADGETVLMAAARTGVVDAVELLISRGADVKAREKRRGQTALMWAAAENNAAAVRALIKAGADFRERSRTGGFTPYLFAVRGGHVETAAAFVEAGVDVNEALPDGTSALVLAVINAHYELAAALVDKGADPNADAQGWTALHQIAWSRRHNHGFNLPGPVQTGNVDGLELARRLVARGASVNARQQKEPRDGNRNLQNRVGATPFLLAAKACDVPYMRVLLELGADPTIPTNNGTTPLMVAAGVGIWAPGENPGTPEEALHAVRLALDAGAGDVNAVDENGDTALHGAVYRGGNVAVIQLLADRGARLDVRNKKGLLPVIIADGEEHTPNVLKRYPEAAALLRKLMAQRGLPVPPVTEHSAAVTEKVSSARPAGGRGGAARPAQAPVTAPAPTTPAPAATPPAPRTTDAGVFTDAQAQRGEAVYRKACAHCHSLDLLGNSEAPALVGGPFTTRWSGTSIDDVVQTMRRTMPQEAPDSLGTAAYVDILSYILKANAKPSGAAELPADRAALQQIRIP